MGFEVVIDGFDHDIAYYDSCGGIEHEGNKVPNDYDNMIIP